MKHNFLFVVALLLGVSCLLPVRAAPTKVKKKAASHKVLESPKAKIVEFSPSEEDLQVFNEETSFETLVKNKVEAARAPAAIESLARVIGLRRDLGLSQADADKAAQDIILNGGSNSGLAEGMTLAVVRKVPIIDPYRENAQSELEVEFAKVKIVHVQKDVAVARLQEIEKISDGMFLGTRGILIGDFVTRAKR